MSAIFDVFTLCAGYGAARLLDSLRDCPPIPRKPMPEAALVELLPYFMVVDPGPPAVVLLKNGCFLSILEFQGPDRASSTDEELNHLVRHFSRTLTPYTNDWTFHCDLQRQPAPSYPPEGAFPHPLLSFLDGQRRASYLAQSALFVSRSFLSVTFRPPAEVYRNFLSRFQQGVEHQQMDWRQNLSTYIQEVKTLQARLATVLKVRPLDPTATLSHLYSCITNVYQDVLDPGEGVYLDRVLATRSLTTGYEPRIDDDQVVIPVSIFHLPSSVSPAYLHALDDLPFKFRLNVRISPLDSRAAGAVIAKYTQGWFMGQKSLRDLLITKQKEHAGDDPFLNQHAVAMMHDASAAAAVNAQGEHRFAYVTAVALVPGANRAEALDHANRLTKELGDLGITTRIETYNAPAAWQGALPGDFSSNLRAPIVNVLPTSDLLPLTTLWPGLSEHPSQFHRKTDPPLLVARTDGNTPFRLLLHHGDLAHTVIVGPPGTGKSTLLSALALGHLRYPGSRVCLFDRDHSAWLLATAAGATHYDLGGENALAFQPLRDLETDAQLGAAQTWLESLVALQIPKVTVDHSRALAAGLSAIATLEKRLRTLSVLAGQISDRTLRAAIELFTVGPYSTLLNASEDRLDASNRFVCFEMRQLLDLDPKVHLPVLLYLLSRIELGLDGSPTMIILDEAGLALLHPTFSAHISAWALTLRKKNAHVVLAFQTLSQLDANSSFSTLLQSCPTRIYLPNDNAVSPDVRRVYEACGLNPRQIELIAQAQRKRHYYFDNPDGARLFELALTPPELAFYGTLPGKSLQETHAAMKRCIEAYGANWQVHWLRLAGEPAAAAELDNYLNR